jgi:2,3-bisphosphoglycerate-dependent phosphoglycerate mutase
MIRLLFIFLLAGSSLTACAQESITTFILIRHAEKDLTQSTNDPDLSAEGKSRSLRLAALLNETTVTAIYSTPYRRTRQTVDPLAAKKNLTISEYTASSEEDIDSMLSKHKGGTLVIAGHSNTIPWFANKLLGMEKYKPLEDGDYDNVWIITVSEKGKYAKLVWLNY